LSRYCGAICWYLQSMNISGWRLILPKWLVVG